MEELAKFMKQLGGIDYLYEIVSWLHEWVKWVWFMSMIGSKFEWID